MSSINTNESKELFQILSNGNLDEKLKALSAMLNFVRSGNRIDSDNLVFSLLYENNKDIVHKIITILTILAFQNDDSKHKICQTSALYYVANKILLSGCVKKIMSVLYFITAMVQSAEDEENQKGGCSDSVIVKNVIRDTGCLDEMCLMFLKCENHHEVWKPLCYCLGECCSEIKENQDKSSHILPKCIQELDNSQGVEVVNLVISLIKDNIHNQLKFVKMKGIHCIVRNLLDIPEGLQLLCASLEKCNLALEEAKECHVLSLLEDIHGKYSEQTSLHALKIKEWSYLALWKLKHSDCPDNKNKQKKTIPKRKLTKEFKYKSLKQRNKKKTIRSDNNSTNINSLQLNTDLKNNPDTLKSSFLSKFDAINSFHFSPRSNEMSTSIYDQTESYKPKKNYLVSQQKYLRSKINKTSHVTTPTIFANLSCQQNNELCTEKENLSRQCFDYESNKNQSNFQKPLNDESFFCFVPKSSSTPLKFDQLLNISPIQEENKIYSINIPSAIQTGEWDFSRTNKKNLLKQNSNKFKSNTNCFIKVPNDIDRPVNDCETRTKNCAMDETIKFEPSTSFKVRELVSQVLDFENKFIAENKEKQRHNTLYYYKPFNASHKDIFDHEKSHQNTFNHRSENFYNFNKTMIENLDNKNSFSTENDEHNLSFLKLEANKIHYNIRKNEEPSTNGKKLFEIQINEKKIDNERLSKKSLEKSFRSKSSMQFLSDRKVLTSPIRKDPTSSETMNVHGKLSHSLYSNNMSISLENIIKRLKIGLSLYGCDFQKISSKLWKNDKKVTPSALYKFYREHIVNK